MLSMGTDYEIININSGEMKVRVEERQTSIAGMLNLKPIYFFQKNLELDNSRLFLVMHGSYSFIVKSDVVGRGHFDEFKIRDLKSELLVGDWAYLDDRNFHEIKLFRINNKNDYAFVAKSRGSQGDYPSSSGEMDSDALIKVSCGRVDKRGVSLVSRYGNVCDYLIEIGSFNDDIHVGVGDAEHDNNEKTKSGMHRELSFSI